MVTTQTLSTQLDKHYVQATTCHLLPLKVDSQKKKKKKKAGLQLGAFWKGRENQSPNPMEGSFTPARARTHSAGIQSHLECWACLLHLGQLPSEATQRTVIEEGEAGSWAHAFGVWGKDRWDRTGHTTTSQLAIQLQVGSKNGNRPIKPVCVLSGQYRVVPVVGDFSIFRGT